MIVTDRRCGWTAEGEAVATIDAGVPVSMADMLTYYGLTPADKHYASIRKPALYVRVILRRANGGFVIAPINPDVVIKDKT